MGKLRLRRRPVEALKPGDRVDLESCPYLKNCASAPYQYAEVLEAVEETPACTRVTYAGGECCGYLHGTKLLMIPFQEFLAVREVKLAKRK